MNEKKDKYSFLFSVFMSFAIIATLFGILGMCADAAENSIIGSKTFTYEGIECTYVKTSYFEIYTGSFLYDYTFSSDVYCIAGKAQDSDYVKLVFVSDSSFNVTYGGFSSTSKAYNGIYYQEGLYSDVTSCDLPINVVPSGTGDTVFRDAFLEYCTSDDFEEIVPLPDLNELSYYPAKLLNFTANNGIKASWTGLQKGSLDLIDTYAIVEFVYKPLDGDTLTKPLVTVTYADTFDIALNGFSIPWLDVQHENLEYYLSCMKVTPIGTDTSSGVTYKGTTSSVLYDTSGSVIVSSLIDDAFDTIHGGGGAQSGTEILSDFYLDGVRIVKSPLVEVDTIKWSRCTNNIEYLTVPNSDTLVLCSVVLYDSDLNIVIEEYASTTIGEGQIKIDWGELEDKYAESDYLWNYEVRLTPGYCIENKLCIGQQTVINIANSTIINEGIDNEDNFITDDVTDDYADWSDNSILDNASNFMTDSEGFIKYISTFFGFVYSLIGLIGDIPIIVGTVFSFLPSVYTDMLGALFIIIVICRVLGR